MITPRSPPSPTFPPVSSPAISLSDRWPPQKFLSSGWERSYLGKSILNFLDFFKDSELITILEGSFVVVHLVDDAAQGPEVGRGRAVVELE